MTSTPGTTHPDTDPALVAPQISPSRAVANGAPYGNQHVLLANVGSYVRFEGGVEVGRDVIWCAPRRSTTTLRNKKKKRGAATLLRVTLTHHACPGFV